MILIGWAPRGLNLSETPLTRSASGCWVDPDAPKIKQPTATTLVEYISEEFADWLSFSYKPGAKSIIMDDDGGCCGTSYAFNEEEVRRLYNFLGCWLDARED